MLYALGVGAGTDDLSFTTENSAGVTLRVLPTMAVVLGAGGFSALSHVGSFDPAMLVHGEQAITLLGEIPTAGEVTTIGEITEIWDKGSGAVVVAESTSTLVGHEDPLFTNRSTVFLRGAGGFGGERGPSGARVGLPDRDPDHVLTMPTRDDQALLYRLSGDRNPLHSDPAFAALAGFDRPILHGLCTFGFAGRALLQVLCGDDPSRLASVEGRFSAPVYPGEQLTVHVWHSGESEALFRTTASGVGEADRLVISAGRVTLAS
jgi:acyl dehydratase